MYSTQQQILIHVCLGHQIFYFFLFHLFSTLLLVLMFFSWPVFSNHFTSSVIQLVLLPTISRIFFQKFACFLKVSLHWKDFRNWELLWHSLSCKIHSDLNIVIIGPQRYDKFFLLQFSLGLEMIAATFIHLWLINFMEVIWSKNQNKMQLFYSRDNQH